MDNPTTIISQNVINVDIDSRAVTLPVNFNLGVMYDNSCKTITFKVKKKSDITDLTDLTFSVNTISAKRKPDKLECDTREEGSFYIITAVLKGTIFEASGKATFNLCGQKFDSSHVAIKVWGSEDITALVGEHSHADKAIEELYPSVLEELKQKVNNPNLTDEQLDNIATKIAEKGFYTKSEVDNLISNIKVPTKLSDLADDATHRLVTDEDKTKWNSYKQVTVDTALNADSNNPVSNKAITTAINVKADKFTVDTVVSVTSDNPVSSKAVSTSLNALSNEIGEGIEAQLAEKADKADLDKKVNKSDVVTTIEESNWSTNENPVAVKAFVPFANSFYGYVNEQLDNYVPIDWNEQSNDTDVTTTKTVSIWNTCNEIIVVGENLKATGQAQIILKINDNILINGVNGGVNTNASYYLAKIELVGYGIMATIREGQYNLSVCTPCYSTIVKADITGIEKVTIGTNDVGATLTSGSFIVYGR